MLYHLRETWIHIALEKVLDMVLQIEETRILQVLVILRTHLKEINDLEKGTGLDQSKKVSKSDHEMAHLVLEIMKWNQHSQETGSKFLHHHRTNFSLQVILETVPLDLELMMWHEMISKSQVFISYQITQMLTLQISGSTLIDKTADQEIDLKVQDQANTKSKQCSAII